MNEKERRIGQFGGRVGEGAREVLVDGGIEQGWLLPEDAATMIAEEAARVSGLSFG